MEWSHKLVLQLIEEFKHKRELWDTSNELYRVFSAKFEAWQALADSFGCEVVDLRKKMNSVFASHRRERHKVRQTGRSTWFAYKRLSFLPTHLGEPSDSDADADGDADGDARDPSEDGAEQATSDDNDDTDDPLQEKFIIKEEPMHCEYSAPAPAPPARSERRPTRPQRAAAAPAPKRQPRRRTLPKRVSAPDRRILEVVRPARRAEARRPRRDECDIFGEYIANSLRKHDERSRSMIKHAINNIIFEQEMKKYVSSQYQIINIEHNPLVLPEALNDADADAAHFQEPDPHGPDYVPSC